MMAKTRKGSAGPGLRLVAVDGASVPTIPARQVVARGGAASATQPPASQSDDGYAFDGRPFTAAECAAMDDGALGYVRGVLAADLAVIEAEYRARAELAEQQVKRMRRAIVDSTLRRTQGEVLTSEAGNELSYVYSGTPWKLTAASARQRYLPEGLVGKMVCYAWGKPLQDAGRPAPAPAVLVGARRDADEDDIPF